LHHFLHPIFSKNYKILDLKINILKIIEFILL
jgi:hypothetical protein